MTDELTPDPTLIDPDALTPVPLPEVGRLAAVMQRLREPGGCAWDAKQTEKTLKSYLLEEAYELLEAIDTDDPEAMCEELGDVLLQVVFQSDINRERGRFTLDDVARGVADKLIRRHPHVFGNTSAESAEAALASWEAIKRKEKEEKAKGEGDEAPSVLSGVPRDLPALLAAFRTSSKAAGVGFEWPDVPSLWGKVEEELAELREAVDSGDREHTTEELGDVFFILANLSRKLGIDPEDALRLSNGKFRNRFRHIERRLHEQGRTPEDATLEEMDELWDEAKRIAREA